MLPHREIPKELFILEEEGTVFTHLLAVMDGDGDGDGEEILEMDGNMG